MNLSNVISVRLALGPNRRAFVAKFVQIMTCVRIVSKEILMNTRIFLFERWCEEGEKERTRLCYLERGRRKRTIMKGGRGGIPENNLSTVSFFS